MTPEVEAPAPRGSGRPAEFVRDVAIESAMELFWQKGFPSVSVSDLAEAMVIHRSSFYNSFGSREAVFREALACYGRQAPDAPLDRVPPTVPIVPVLVGVLRDVCRVRAADSEHRGCLVCNSVAELVGVDDTVGPMVSDLVEARIVRVGELLRTAADRGEMPRPADIEGSARAFVAFLVGLNTLSKIVTDEARLWSMCKAFLSGLGIPRQALTRVEPSGSRDAAGDRIRRRRPAARRRSARR